MTSPARRHFQRHAAAQVAAATPRGEAPTRANAYELMLMQLAEHRRALKQVQSIERKIDVKRQILPVYMPWVEGALEAGRGGQDAVLMTVMVWAIDVGEYALALRIAGYALEHDLVLPDQYKRDVATLVVEEIVDAALATLPAESTVDLPFLCQADTMTVDRDMPDEVRAKLFKAIGLTEALAITASAAPDPGAGAVAQLALSHLRRAFALNTRVGVKKDIERLERIVRDNPPSPISTENAAAETGASDGTAPADPPGAPAPERSG